MKTERKKEGKKEIEILWEREEKEVRNINIFRERKINRKREQSIERKRDRQKERAGHERRK